MPGKGRTIRRQQVAATLTGAPGRPNELTVNSNIETAYEFAVNGLHWDPKSIILFGRSIGTGPAVRLAAEREVGGVILVSPYTSVKDMVRNHAGFLTSWLTAELSNMSRPAPPPDSPPQPPRPPPAAPHPTGGRHAPAPRRVRRRGSRGSGAGAGSPRRRRSGTLSALR